MFWDNVVNALLAQGTILVIAIGLGLVIWAVFKTAKGANRVLSQIPIPNVRWPRLSRLPHIAWERVSEPTKKVAMMILAIAGVVVIGVAAPLFSALRLAQLAGVADPNAYVVSGVLLSTFVVSLGGLYLLVKQRNALHEMGASRCCGTSLGSPGWR